MLILYRIKEVMLNITAHADDFDRGDESPTDAGYNESPETDWDP